MAPACLATRENIQVFVNGKNGNNLVRINSKNLQENNVYTMIFVFTLFLWYKSEGWQIYRPIKNYHSKYMCLHKHGARVFVYKRKYTSLCKWQKWE